MSGREYTPMLERIRAVLETCYARFPQRCCYQATRAVHDVTGLEMVAGFYRFPNEVDAKGNVAFEEHFWNYDPARRLYVDITQDQFEKRANKAIPRMVVVSKYQLPELVEDWKPEMLPQPLMPSVAEALRKEFPRATIPQRPSMQTILQSALVES